MPKNIWYELPCGAMYKFKEHRYEDIAPVDFILENIPKSEIVKVYNPDNCGRKRIKTAQQFNGKIVRALWMKIIDRLMESDTLVIDKDTKLYIGVAGTRNDGRLVKFRKKKLNYMHTKAIYGIVLNGFFHTYNFRMPFRRRKELYERLKKGQNFIT